MFGLQLVWSTEMAYASPYLLSLGKLCTQSKRMIGLRSLLSADYSLLRLSLPWMRFTIGLSKSGMSAVFLAGPLSGNVDALLLTILYTCCG